MEERTAPFWVFVEMSVNQTHMSQDEQVLQLIIDHQLRLRAFIRSLVPNHASADDVLQETNLVLWRKLDQFAIGTDFGAWACKIAWLQIRAHWQKHGRDRLVFDEGLMLELAQEAEKSYSDLERRLAELRACLNQLTSRQRDLLRRRYTDNQRPTEIAEKLKRPVGSIRQTIYRIRQSLLACIQQKLTGEQPV